MSDSDAKARSEEKQAAIEELCAVLTMLETPEDAQAFLRDLCTPGELLALAERWRIARLLNDGTQSYREIAEATHASTTTVARVARFLKDEPWQGYRRVLDRLGEGAATTKPDTMTGRRP